MSADMIPLCLHNGRCFCLYCEQLRQKVIAAPNVAAESIGESNL